MPEDGFIEATCLFSFSLQKEVYMIAAGVIGGVFLICTVVMFLGVKERDGEIIVIIVYLFIFKAAV